VDYLPRVGGLTLFSWQRLVELGERCGEQWSPVAPCEAENCPRGWPGQIGRGTQEPGVRGGAFCSLKH